MGKAKRWWRQRLARSATSQGHPRSSRVPAAGAARRSAPLGLAEGHPDFGLRLQSNKRVSPRSRKPLSVWLWLSSLSRQRSVGTRRRCCCARPEAGSAMTRRAGAGRLRKSLDSLEETAKETEAWRRACERTGRREWGGGRGRVCFQAQQQVQRG